ncbi:MAG: hypothetical protein HYV47_04045 [Candidatus Nealsonbacteria bacterium]|nr:hypothetical protein [Candidatus Nealsonbacteria bacterium]
MAIEKGTLVMVEGAVVHITTMNREGRLYERDKRVPPGRPIFGTVEGTYEVQKAVFGENEEIVKPAKFVAFVQWDGPKHRTSILPLEKLQPAINDVLNPAPLVEAPKKSPRRRKTTKKQ